MEIKETPLPGALLIQPKIFGDQRGYFFEAYNKKMFDDYVEHIDFIQDNESKSSYGVLRGLHYQLPPYTQAKLVRVIDGAVLDVIVDIRKNSPTFGKHFTTELNATNKLQLFIPGGFAHGFAVLSSHAVFTYKVDSYYAPGYEAGIRHNDPALGIDWQIPVNERILSDKDKVLADFANAKIFDAL